MTVDSEVRNGFKTGSTAYLRSHARIENMSTLKGHHVGNGHAVGAAENGVSVTELPHSNVASEIKPEAKLIGVNGYWYDITNFIPHHPGGDVIERFVGKDGSEVFNAFHHGKSILKFRKPVGTFTNIRTDPASKEFGDLLVKFQDMGLFKTSVAWYINKTLIAAAMFLIVVYLFVYKQEWYWHALAGVMLAAFWQQCGFFLHDYMHNQVFHDRVIDQWLGTFFGTVGVGLSGSWWRDEHFVHHALTNTVDYATKFIDPQMNEPIWAQHALLYPFFSTKFEQSLIRIQHFTFIPVCVFIGRIGIIVDSFHAEKRLREWVAFALHCAWVGLLFSYLPTWSRVMWVYALASMLEGILHVQLLISHYAKPFRQQDEVCNELDWYRMQVECNLNIKNPIWLDWFHGGLNFHIEHHLYPTMPRHSFRQASKYIKESCQRMGITYDECGWLEAVTRTLLHLKTSGQHFKLDPR